MEPPVTDAVIIPFPTPRARVAEPAQDARLQAALEGLQSALAAQADAVAEWRFAMAELGVGVAALGHSLAAYDGSLETLDGKLHDLRTTARVLEAAADSGLTGTR
jgi:cytochrome c-type biogenesis protein CcmH/NrfG